MKSESDRLKLELGSVTHQRNNFVNELSHLAHLVTDKSNKINALEEKLRNAKI